MIGIDSIGKRTIKEFMENGVGEKMTLEQIAAALVRAAQAFDAGMRRLNPLALADIRKRLLVHVEELVQARHDLQNMPDAGEASVQKALLRACDFFLAAVRGFADEEDLQAAYIAALRSARKHCRALEALYPLCGVFPVIDRYFLEPGAVAPSPSPDKPYAGETGIVHAGSSGHPHERGGYSLYIPEDYTPDRAWPLVVALHGGYSHGRDFIWTWLREARSRGFVVFAPTSRGMTWSIDQVADDGELLKAHLKEIASRVSIDRSRIFLTGMSDGGTFALALGLSGGSAYPAIAPVSAALPPVDLQRVKGKRILWIHGAQDWIFPAQRTVQSCRYLQQAGADIRLQMIEDLSHAYPREANAVILEWFGISGTR